MESFRLMLRRKPFSLVVSLPANDPEMAKAAWDNGADALKVHVNVGHRASGNVFGTFDEQRDVLNAIVGMSPGPIGIVPGGSVEAALSEIDDIVRAGFGFVSLYAHHMSPLIMSRQDVEKMVAPDYTYSLEEISMFGRFGVDVLEASVIHPQGYGEPLNLRDLVKYRAIAAAVDLPVLVPTQRAIRPEEVRALYDAGVRAVMIGAVVAGKSTEGIAEATRRFRRAIDQIFG